MKKTIIILAALAALVYAISAGMNWITPRVEKDLTDRVNVALAEQGLLWADVATTGRNVTLSGEAPDMETKDKALAAAARVFGVAQVNDSLTVAEAPANGKKAKLAKANKSYTLTITKTDEDVVLTGQVDSEQSKDVIERIAATHYGEEHVSSSLVVAENAPAGWRSAVGTVLFNLVNLEQAEAKLAGREIMVSGTVVDAMYSTQLSEQLGTALPKDYKLAVAVDVVTPTVVEEVAEEVKEVTEKTADLDEAPKSPNQKAAEAEAESKTAKVEPAAGETKAEKKAEAKPAPVKVAAKEEPKVVAEKPAAKAPEKAKEPVKAAETDTIADKDTLPAKLAEVKKELGICDSATAAVVTGAHLYFGFDDARVTSEGNTTAKKVASALATCANLKVEVAGYTDSTGSQLYNQWLSEQRAEAGARALVRNGVARARLTAKGYGVTDKPGNNATKEGRAQNRRVDFNQQ